MPIVRYSDAGKSVLVSIECPTRYGDVESLEQGTKNLPAPYPDYPSRLTHYRKQLVPLYGTIPLVNKTSLVGMSFGFHYKTEMGNTEAMQLYVGYFVEF